MKALLCSSCLRSWGCPTNRPRRPLTLQPPPLRCSGPRAAPPAAGQGAGDVKAVRAQLDLMEQDAARVSAPDYNTPFASLEDAVDRLLPYHVRALGGCVSGLGRHHVYPPAIAAACSLPSCSLL